MAPGVRLGYILHERNLRFELYYATFSSFEDSIDGYVADIGFGPQLVNLDVSLDQDLAMVGIFYDFDVTSKARPFVGLYGGYLMSDVKLTVTVQGTGVSASQTSSATSFTWGATAGFTYPMKPHIDFETSALYLHTRFEEGQSTFQINAGLRFSF